MIQQTILYYNRICILSSKLNHALKNLRSSTIGKKPEYKTSFYAHPVFSRGWPANLPCFIILFTYLNSTVVFGVDNATATTMVYSRLLPVIYFLIDSFLISFLFLPSIFTLLFSFLHTICLEFISLLFFSCHNSTILNFT